MFNSDSSNSNSSIPNSNVQGISTAKEPPVPSDEGGFLYQEASLIYAALDNGKKVTRLGFDETSLKRWLYTIDFIQCRKSRGNVVLHDVPVSDYTVPSVLASKFVMSRSVRVEADLEEYVDFQLHYKVSDVDYTLNVDSFHTIGTKILGSQKLDVSQFAELTREDLTLSAALNKSVFTPHGGRVGTSLDIPVFLNFDFTTDDFDFKKSVYRRNFARQFETL